ncbi:SMP-30/gluconolactonase/LRE family protein [Fulvivirgaceae bacterium PWU4]|uniref:SMP-30/gluconolactonase/LRE family protein n=2 Tax=Chryseosolibacter histidini TaxID=2782349 RepID=A0AAP2DJN1_9BACT|nr:SMP-30/gluconolactonase/LRE family protein [Chryseosolibacter histidini]
MKETKTIGSIERIDAAVNDIISEKATIEVLAEGYDWSEGPIWVDSQKMLLFSDVPKNTIYKWTEKNGAEAYLSPSGYTGSEPTQSKEPGSNGLTLDNEGRLILCQHGDRRLARLDASFDQPKAAFVSLADRYDGKRFNSPNDVVCRKNGDLFFTDPPYGLPLQNESDPAKEIPFQGVYKVSADGKLTLLVDSLTRPNGLAFTPDEKTLIVANSDPDKAIWYAFDITANDSLVNQRIFYNATAEAKAENNGLPDGLKIDRQGNVFATGPGGVWIFNKEGKVLGKIRTPVPTANCAFADGEKTLFLTSDNYLLRVKLRE